MLSEEKLVALIYAVQASKSSRYRKDVPELIAEIRALRKVYEAGKKLAESINWCEKTDEPVSGYIDCNPIEKAIAEYERN